MKTNKNSVPSNEPKIISLAECVEHLKAIKYNELEKLKDQYCEDQDSLEASIVKDLSRGMNHNYNWKPYLVPLGIFGSPIRVPCWMFRRYSIDCLNLNDVEKVALAHVIHFTNPQCPTGYMPLTGGVENWCKVGSEVVEEALSKLERDGLICGKELEPDYCYGHKRNKGYTANIELLHHLLQLFKMDVWS